MVHVRGNHRTRLLHLAGAAGEQEDSRRVVARLSAEALRNNYQAILDQVPGLSILPMLKAQAYGHGAVWAARELLAMPSLYGFGVATIDEALEIRRELGPRARRVKIVVMSGGASLWSEEKGQICEKHGLTPVIGSDADWHLFLRGGWAERLSYEIEFNTGMNRLGLTPGMAPSVARALEKKPHTWHPDGVFSHLALGESPDARLSLRQKERFGWLRGQLEGALPSAHFHLGNSAAIWNQKQWGLLDLTDVVRPGLSLYGVPPWKGAPARGIEPVMTWEAQVVQVHRLKPGESVGYGATYKVKGPQAETIAIVSAGYADGVSRVMSNRGHLWLNGKLVPIVGVISMDLCAVRCAEGGARAGDYARILGEHVDPWEQAEAAGTIPYELLTSVSGRVQRIYDRRT